MASLSTRITDLATRMATEVKALRTLINGNAADLSGLNTTAKANLVAAINEVLGAAQAGGSAAHIDDSDGAATSSSTTASNARIRALISKATADLVNGSSAALDTLNELAAAIGNDPNYAASMATALGNRLRLDTNQTLTSAQQLQGRSNLDVYSKADVGTPDTDFVAVFTSALA